MSFRLLMRDLIVANSVTAVLALLPWLAIDALYVYGGQTDQGLKSTLVEATVLIFSILTFGIANWLAFKRSDARAKWWIYPLVTTVSWGGWFIVSLFFVYWFHLAIGGQE